MQSITAIRSFPATWGRSLLNVNLQRTAGNSARQASVYARQWDYNNRVNIFREVSNYAQTGMLLNIVQ